MLPERFRFEIRILLFGKFMQTRFNDTFERNAKVSGECAHNCACFIHPFWMYPRPSAAISLSKLHAIDLEIACDRQCGWALSDYVAHWLDKADCWSRCSPHGRYILFSMRIYDSTNRLQLKTQRINEIKWNFSIKIRLFAHFVVIELTK